MSWQRIRVGMTCAYGCEIRHPDWAWFGKYPMVVCEPCAAKYDIHRPQPNPANESEPDNLVPASPEPRTFTSMGDLAEQFEAGTLKRPGQPRTRGKR